MGMYGPIRGRWFPGGKGFLFVRTYKLVEYMLVANTVWGLVLLFLMLNNVFPEFNYGEDSDHAGSGMVYGVCGFFGIIVMFLPLFFGISSRTGWPMGYVLGCAFCWVYVALLYASSNFTDVLLLYISPLPGATTLALAFNLYYGRQVGIL